MLVMSRKLDESIIIGNEIEIVVVRIDRNTVRLGIKAPRNISVHRKEVYDEIKLENLEAVKTPVMDNEALQKLLSGKIKVTVVDQSKDKKKD